MKRFIRLISLVLLLISVGCAEVSHTPTSSDPAAIGEAFLDASSGNDIETGLSLLSEDIVFRQEPAGIEIKGKEKLEQLFRENATFHHQHQLTSPCEVKGDKVTRLAKVSGDDLRIMGIDYMNVTYEFLVRDGKIYSMLVTADEEDWAKVVKHNSGGIGIKPSFVEEGVRVEGFTEQSPAKDAGLRIGDVITAVDGVSCSEIGEWEMLLRIKGPAGSTVRLSVFRKGLDEPIGIEVTRIRLQ